MNFSVGLPNSAILALSGRFCSSSSAQYVLLISYHPPSGWAAQGIATSAPPIYVFKRSFTTEATTSKGSRMHHSTLPAGSISMKGSIWAQRGNLKETKSGAPGSGAYR